MKVKVISVAVELSFGQDFLTFLNQNNALERFCTKFCSDKGIEYLASLISRVCPRNWISSAFVWDDIEFWKNLSNKWEKTISQPEVRNVTFEVVDKDNSQGIWDKMQVYSGSLQGKYYTVGDNSWNRLADRAIDLQVAWDWDDNSWKDLIGKTYLILSERPVLRKLKNWDGCGEMFRSFIKVWVPEQECVQWVLYQGCSRVKKTKNDEIKLDIF